MRKFWFAKLGVNFADFLRNNSIFMQKIKKQTNVQLKNIMQEENLYFNHQWQKMPNFADFH